jgi:hypothetical protein
VQFAGTSTVAAPRANINAPLTISKITNNFVAGSGTAHITVCYTVEPASRRMGLEQGRDCSTANPLANRRYRFSLVTGRITGLCQGVKPEMMTRRGFFGGIVLGAALALHTELHSLAPVFDFAPKLLWFYLIEESYRAVVPHFGCGVVRKHVRWISEEEMLALGLKHEDFVDAS